MPRTRTPLAVITAAATALALAACGGASEATDGATTVQVGTLRGQPHLFTPFLYEEHLAEGTEMEIVLFDTSTDIKNAVASGAVEFGVAGAPSALAGVAAGQEVRIIASSADGGTRIVGSLEISGVADLAGSTIGYPMGASQEILLRLTLQAHGIDPDTDVELVNLPFADMASAWESGQIDAFSSAETGPSIAINAGAHEIVSPYETPVGRVNIVLMTSGDVIAEAPDVVQTVVDAHALATEDLLSDPDAWGAGVVTEFGVDADVVETAIENIWPRWDLDEEYQEQVLALSEEMLALDQLPNAVDPSAIFDTTFIDGVTAP